MAEYKTSMKDNFGSDGLGQTLIKKAQSAFNSTERQNVETLWQELAEFILPNQNGCFFNNQAGKGNSKEKSRRIFDITAPMACRDAASAMHSIVTNPATKWSKLRFRETELNNSPEANKWLSDATNEIHNALNDSNFDNQAGEAYQSLIGLGTFVLLHDELTENGIEGKINFTAWHLGEIAYLENHLGIVDTIYHKFMLTAKQAFEKFGDEVGEEIKQKLDTNPGEELELYHCIYPRNKDEIKLNKLGLAAPKHRPFASCYVMSKGNKIVKEDGYYEFPVYVSRWLKMPGEIYGYGPGHVARPDVLTLNVLTRQILKGLAKAVDPTIFTNQNNILTGDMRPGKIVTVRNINDLKEGLTQSRFDVSFIEAKELKESIKAAFYVDKLMLPPRTQTGEMTAFEIEQRLQQTQVILGPPLSRLNFEFLTPLIMRTLSVLMRSGRIPPIPEEVIQQSKNPERSKREGVFIDIAFINSLARSQQLSELKNIMSFVQDIAGMAQIKPEALDMLDIDAIVEKMARIRDIPEELIVDDENVQQVRQQRAQQAEMANTLQMGESISGSAKNMAAATNSGQGIPNK